jgi:hypothetical protein
MRACYKTGFFGYKQIQTLSGSMQSSRHLPRGHHQEAQSYGPFFTAIYCHSLDGLATAGAVNLGMRAWQHAGSDLCLLLSQCSLIVALAAGLPESLACLCYY